MSHNDMSNIDFNELAAFCDAQLPPEQMARYEQLVSSDPVLSSMLDDIDKIDMDITDNICSDEVMNEAQFADVVLPNIEVPENTSVFSDITDSFDDFSSSLFIDDSSLTDADDDMFNDLNDAPLDGDFDHDL